MISQSEQVRQKELQDLKKEYWSLADKNTPDEIKNYNPIDLTQEQAFEFRLTKELIERFKLDDWLVDYEKEAEVAIAGIRGPQNILYYWDYRFPINQMGVVLSTLGKILILQQDIASRKVHKIVSSEVRYNSKDYVELISRLQAAAGIHVHRPYHHDITAMPMVSFLILTNDYDGGEYITSSHAISSKTGIKNLDNQGSQFLPEMNLRFVGQIKKILQQAKESSDGYLIKFSAKNDPLISDDFDGYDQYTEYLKKIVARPTNLNLIKKQIDRGFKVMIENVGGSAYKTFRPVLEKLEIAQIFDWRNIEDDPFFHGIGKIWRLNQQNSKKEFFDLSCDFCLGEVMRTASLEYDLENKPLGYIVLITDPDADRLVMGQVEPIEQIKTLDELGIEHLKINEDKIFAFYHPTYSFFLIMDYYMKLLKQEGLWNDHPRFIITTAPSSKCWDEWAKNNNLKIITTPVGFKEIAQIIKKIEKQILIATEKDVIIRDIWGNDINLGKNPRMVFGGEESGGMITGAEELITTRNGRQIIAMREKSAGEAMIIAAGLAAYLFEQKKLISEYLTEVFRENKIKNIYYFRDDIVYYNESEPDPVKMKQDKAQGEIKRDQTDSFYLGLALALKDKKINLEQVREVLQQAIPSLNFQKLQDIKFTGDATYFPFDNLFVQVRRSGTDAKMRGYSNGSNKNECREYLDKLLHFDGQRTEKYKNMIPLEYRADIYSKTQKLYQDYLYYQA